MLRIVPPYCGCGWQSTAVARASPGADHSPTSVSPSEVCSVTALGVTPSRPRSGTRTRGRSLRRATRRTAPTARRGRRPSRCAGRSGLSDVDSARSFATHFAGSQYWTRVVQTRRHEQRGIGRRARCRRASTPSCARTRPGSRGSPHSSRSVTVSGSDGVEHRRDDVDERHFGDDRREQVGAQVGHRAHEEAAGTSAASHEARGRRIPVRDQVLRAGDEVGEGVGLVLEPSGLVPRATHLAAAPDVGDREDEAAVEQRERDARNDGSVEISYEP